MNATRPFASATGNSSRLATTTFPELYNLANDRAEVNNLAAAHPERVQIMADRWEAWARSAKVVPRDRSEK